MNPLWAVFFKDKFRTPFSIYKMSLAEIIFLGTLVVASGYGLAKVVKKIIDFESTPINVEETK